MSLEPGEGLYTPLRSLSRGRPYRDRLDENKHFASGGMYSLAIEWHMLHTDEIKDDLRGMLVPLCYSES